MRRQDLLAYGLQWYRGQRDVVELEVRRRRAGGCGGGGGWRGGPGPSRLPFVLPALVWTQQLILPACRPDHPPCPPPTPPSPQVLLNPSTMPPLVLADYY